MKRVRKFLPENRLAKAFDDPRGIPVGLALERAAENLAEVRASHLAHLDAKLNALEAQAPEAAASGDPADAAVFYQLARDILADSGTLGLKHVSEAALSLCDLMASGRGGRSLWVAVGVHVDALAALRRPEAAQSAAVRDAVLRGLARISRVWDA